MKFKKLRIILIAVLTVIIGISAFNIIKITHDYKTADKANTKLQERFVQEVDSTKPMADEEQIQVPISVDFNALTQENSDIVGWIYCPDTPINYPVVRGKDNNQYLRADLNGKYLVSGTIFTDYRNGEVGADPNYIVYGHNMKNATMFGTLVKYKEQSYYDSHPVLYFLTPEANYIIELSAGAVVKRDSDIYQTTPKNSTIANITASSTFDSNIELAEGETIITLSTCSYEFNNARYVAIGRLTRI